MGRSCLPELLPNIDGPVHVDEIIDPAEIDLVRSQTEAMEENE